METCARKIRLKIHKSCGPTDVLHFLQKCLSGGPTVSRSVLSTTNLHSCLRHEGRCDNARVKRGNMRDEVCSSRNYGVRCWVAFMFGPARHPARTVMKQQPCDTKRFQVTVSNNNTPSASEAGSWNNHYRPKHHMMYGFVCVCSCSCVCVWVCLLVCAVTCMCAT